MKKPEFRLEDVVKTVEGEARILSIAKSKSKNNPYENDRTFSFVFEDSSECKCDDYCNVYECDCNPQDVLPQCYCDTDYEPCSCVKFEFDDDSCSCNDKCRCKSY